MLIIQKIEEKIENEIKYFDFFKRILKRGIKKRYVKAPLKTVLTVLCPVLLMAAATLILAERFRDTVDNFALFFYCGEIIFLFLFGSAYMAMDTVKENAGYMKSVYLPKHLFVLSSVTQSAVLMLFFMVLALPMMLFTAAPFSAGLLTLPLLSVLMFMFAFGFSLILAAYKPIFKKLRWFYLGFSVIWLAVSPVFYPMDAIPESIRFVFDVNPAVHYMKIMRTICCSGSMPSENTLITASIYSVLVMLLGISVFKANESKFLLYV